MPRFLKTILWALASLVLLCFASIALLPTIISTSWGTKKAVEVFNKQGRGTLSIEDLHLSWLGGQTLHDLVYKDENGETLLSIEMLNTRTSLFYLFFGGEILGDTIIREPYVVIGQTQKEDSKKEEKKERRKRKSGSRWAKYIFQTSANFSLHDGTVIFKPNQGDPISISAISIQKIQEQNSFHIAANTRQRGVEGSVEVDISLQEKVCVSGEVKNFPLEILDQFDQSTRCSDAFGKTMDINFNLAKKQEESISLIADIKSQNLNGLLKGETRENKLFLDPSSRLAFTMTPRFFKSLLPENQKDEWSLAHNTDIKLEISKGIFPLNFKKPDFSDTILQSTATVERAEINHKTLGGYALKSFSAEINILKTLEITYGGEIQGREQSLLSGKVSVSPEEGISFISNFHGFPVSLIRLLSPEIEKNIDILTGRFFNLNTEGRYQQGKLEMNINLSAPSFYLNSTLNGSLDQMNFALSGNKKMAGPSTLYFGSEMDFEIDGQAKISKNEMSIPLLNGTISTPYYKVDVKGAIGKKEKRLSLNDVELIATGEVIDLPYSNEFPEVALKNGGFFINIDGQSNKISGEAFVNTQITSDQGLFDSKALQARFEIADSIQENSIDLKKANISFKTELDHLPLALLNPILPGEIDITKLFGKTATITAQGNYRNNLFSLDFSGKGERVDTQLSIMIDETLNITQKKPGYVHWQLTPEGYNKLINFFRPEHKQVFYLAKPASIDLSIKELTCPATQPKGFGQFLCETGIVGDLEIGPLTFQSQEAQEYLVVKKTSGSIKGENFSKAIELHLRGDILAQNVPQSEKSSFQFDGVMVNFWTPEGKFNREGLAVDGELSLELLPVRQITEIYPMDEDTKRLVQAVLGELVNARIYGRISQMTGPLTVDVKSSNFKATLPILFYPNAIYLREAVNAEITVTPEVNQTLIADINPLLITGVYSDHPIKIFIDPQGFVLPIRPYYLQGVQIGRAVIDIGKICVRNGGQIQKLMSFLKATDITPEGEMHAWFTPIFMSLNNGVAVYPRFDMLLANEFHIGLWGSVNLINKQVDMTLGIAPSTLKKRFNVKGIPKKDMFQVKMRGTTEKLDLDWSSASTRIGILIAKTATGHIGAIIGGIIEQIMGALGEEPTPPPTTSPFPWER
ncbi:MAG: hypothetical protein JJU12_01740 [Chlamydiales bacterium]|nr:hypothetical protein [Chlamydiales bacterium]